MKKSVVKTTILAALAIFIAGAVLTFLFVKGGDSNASLEGKSEAALRAPQPLGVVTNRVVCKDSEAHKKLVRKRPSSKRDRLPAEFVRSCIQHASDEENYKWLAMLLQRKDQIADSASRLALLEALTWFDETALPDALQFLDDADEKVSATAAEIVTTRITSIRNEVTRARTYAQAMKKMKNSPDLDIMVAELEGESKAVVLSVVLDMEEACKLRPTLWKKLTSAYEEHFGRAYTTRTDALMNYNPSRDNE